MYTTNMDLEVKLFIWRVMICIYANYGINVQKYHQGVCVLIIDNK